MFKTPGEQAARFSRRQWSEIDLRPIITILVAPGYARTSVALHATGHCVAKPLTQQPEE
jgi:hypothetical protein